MTASRTKKTVRSPGGRFTVWTDRVSVDGREYAREATTADALAGKHFVAFGPAGGVVCGACHGRSFAVSFPGDHTVVATCAACGLSSAVYAT